MKTTRATQVRVGLLILLSLVALGGTVVMLGKERRFFENRVNYEIHYSRINGLTKGAPVSLSGVKVGSDRKTTSWFKSRWLEMWRPVSEGTRWLGFVRTGFWVINS